MLEVRNRMKAKEAVAASASLPLGPNCPWFDHLKNQDRHHARSHSPQGRDWCRVCTLTLRSGGTAD
jgi:hypothetical protein